MLINTFTGSWALSILFAAAAVQLCSFPLNILYKKASEKTKLIDEKVKAASQTIRSQFSGEEAHMRMDDFYRSNNLSPFYKVKPFLYTLIQIPVLIIVGSVLLFMPEMEQTTFLWIKNLSQPDALFTFKSSIPFWGQSVNILPIVLITIIWLSEKFTYKRLFGGFLYFCFYITFPQLS